MTKAEEREVLQKICELIKSTGTDSYISMAFRGVPDYAMQNIEDDAGYNPVEERDLLAKKYEELRKSHADAEKEASKRLLKLEHERDVAYEQLQQSREAYEEKHQMWCKATDAVAELNKTVVARDAEIDLLKERVNEQDDEIVRLKAELYDYMRKEREQ